jgi:hypothetical protein
VDLQDLLIPAFRADRQLGIAFQDQLLKRYSALGATIFKDRHSDNSTPRGFGVIVFLGISPGPGLRQASLKTKSRKPGNAGQDKKYNQQDNEDQCIRHSLILELSGLAW